MPLQPQRRGSAPVRRPGRRRHLPLHPLRAHRRPPGVRQLRAARSQGALHLRRHRAGGWQIAVRATPSRAGPHDAGLGHRDVRPDAAPVDLPHRGGRRALPPGRGRLAAARSPLGVLCRASMAEHLEPGGDLHRHPAGPGLLRPRLRLPLPLGQVRLDLRPRVQPRRDGEPRPRHLHRGLPPPRCGDARGPGPPGRGDPARDGAHVVRRPGDPALVGRHVAEGVVRRPDGLPRHARRRPSSTARGSPSPAGARRGPTARTSCPRRTRSSRRSTTSRRRGRTSTASPTPRARRCSSS